MNKIKNKRILITGSCGTVGSELIKQLLTNNKYDPKEVIGIDNNESQLFFQDSHSADEERASFYVADICDRDVLMRKMHNIDVVIHAAALKHVILGERSPEQVVQTNIYGMQNIIFAADYNNVEIVIFTSSDKAVNPTNVMGASKLMGERIMTAANSNAGVNGPIFVSTRFGNVLGSNGSVLPIFKSQIENGGPVTLTDKRMTRFVMSIKQSAELVLDSMECAKGGEVFVTKMPVVKIQDLAIAMIEELFDKSKNDAASIEIIEIGSKPGEKLYEEHMSTEEVERAVELKEYFSVLPAFQKEKDFDYDSLVETSVDNPYISHKEKALTIQEIKKFLKENNLLEDFS